MKNLLTLVLLMVSCQTHKVSQKRPKRQVIVRYNNNVIDTLTTDFHYNVGKLEYIGECSCDGTLLGYIH
ncbi:hypothetical protein [Spirosoma fluviale]|uniref:Uncharacterized protein n=1 Tax=Spirosoma fluviale TaxID=1597977 RepID=A0A286FCF1_9BACT|nr:hypothetical protein [Spirosoma fluviale]SOD80873.1 hypothetical protein SAMN06269250_1595 [Spirosoma fluviale]